MDTLAKRLRYARSTLRGLTQQELQRLSGVKQSDISKTERGATQSPSNLLALARALQVNPDWLDVGDGPMVNIHQNQGEITYDNVTPVVAKGREVPLISWVKAGSWADIQDNFEPGDAESWVVPEYSKPRSHAFALRVVNDSMTSPFSGAQSFPEGTIIIVDPDALAGPNDYVVAKDVATQEATFKKLITDGGRWFLKPLNPAYPTIEIDDPAIRVIGKAIEFKPPGGKL